MISRFAERVRTDRATRAVLATLLAYSLLYWVPASPLPKYVPWGVISQGVIFGTSYALLAMGLILIYRTTRIVNFAYGAMGAMPGSLTVGLFIAKDWNYWIAIALGIAVGVATGAAVDVFVVRRRTSRSSVATGSWGSPGRATSQPRSPLCPERHAPSTWSSASVTKARSFAAGTGSASTVAPRTDGWPRSASGRAWARSSAHVAGGVHRGRFQQSHGRSWVSPRRADGSPALRSEDDDDLRPAPPDLRLSRRLRGCGLRAGG